MAPFDPQKIISVNSGAALGTEVSVFLKAKTFGGSSGARFEYKPASPTHLVATYRVFVPADFQPKLGGKLGFGANGDEFCIRTMWRRDDAKDATRFGAEIYCHGPDQLDPDYTKLPGFKRTDGDSLYQYYFWLNKGAWNTVRLECRLNDVGVANGFISSTINGRTYQYGKYTFRTKAETTITSALFQTFFGGSTSAWAPDADQCLIFDHMDISG